MSLWWYGRKRGGKRSLWQIDTDPLAILSATGFLAWMLVAYIIRCPLVTGYVSAVLLLSGLACLIVAKVSLYRQGVWLSFGPGLMTKGYAGLYKMAYVLMGVGVLLMVLLLGALRALG